MLKRLLLGIALTAVLAPCAAAQTGSPKTKSQLDTEIRSTFPDNTVGSITPLAVRQQQLDFSATLFAGAGAAVCGSAGDIPVYNGATWVCSTIGGAPVTINPTVNVWVQGLRVNQSIVTATPAPAAPIALNYIGATINGTVNLTGATNGLPNAFVAALRTDTFTGGANMSAALTTTILATITDNTLGGTQNEIDGFIAFAYGKVANTTAGLHGFDGLGLVDVGGSYTSVVGGEFAAGICDGSGAGGGGAIGPGGTINFCQSAGVAGVAVTRYGAQIVAIGQKKATGLDAGLVFTNNGSTGAAFDKLIVLSNFAGNYPLGTGSDVIYTDTAATVTNFANLTNLNVTGSILSFPALNMTGSGRTSFGANIALSGNEIIRVVRPGGTTGSASLFADFNGTSGVDGVLALTSDGLNGYTLYANEASRTATFLGVTTGNTVSLATSGASNGGLLIGTVGNFPVVLGANNARVLTLYPSGGVALDGFGDPGANNFFAGAIGVQATAGAGFIAYTAQSSPPSAPAGGYRQYADSSGRLAWIRQSDGFSRTFDATLTASRVYTLPDASITIAGFDVAHGGTNCSVASGTCLDNITGFASTGIISRTGAGAYSFRTITGTANQTSVSNGDGVSGNPTIALIGPYTPATYTSNGVLYGNGTSSIQATAQGGANTVLVANAGAPSFTSSPTLSGNLTFSTSGDGVVGTTTNDSANAGIIGEYIESVIALGSAVGLTNNTTANMTSISLTAGDWDVDAVFTFTGGATTTVSYIAGSVSSTSTTFDATNGRAQALPFNNATIFNVTNTTVSVPPLRRSLSGTTTIFAVALAGFGTSTCSVFGIIRARRVR